MLKSTLERPIYAIACRFLFVCYRTFGVSPLRSVLFPFIILAASLVTMAALFLQEQGLLPTVIAAAFLTSGTVIGARACTVIGCIPNKWTASDYRRETAIANWHKNRSKFPRLGLVLVALMNISVALSSMHNGEPFVAKAAIGVGSMLFWIAAYEYIRSAELPPPDNGDAISVVPMVVH